jgi:pimeloyl-ACP methyl ester carboxylesterase
VTITTLFVIAGILEASFTLDGSGSGVGEETIILCVVLAVVHFWLCVRFLNLWLSTSEVQVLAAEEEIFRLYGKNPVKLVQVAGLGTTLVLEPDYIGRNVPDPDTTAALDEKPPLVMLHGYGGANGYWAPCCERLSDRFKIYLVELPGFGRSVRTAIRGLISPDDCLRLMSDALERWREDMGIESFVLVGHSLGSHAASAYAVRFPSRVKRLFLVSPVAVGVAPRIARTDSDWVNYLLEFVWNWSTVMDYVRYTGPLAQPLIYCAFTARVGRSHRTLHMLSYNCLDRLLH